MLLFLLLLIWVQIEGGEQIPSGSEEEVEIRACTVVAVERLKAALEEKLQGSASVPGLPAIYFCAGTRGYLALYASSKA